MNQLYSLPQISALWLATRIASLLLMLAPALVQAQQYDDAPEQLSVMTWNVEWMFDNYTGDNRSKLSREQSAPTKEFWDHKVEGVAAVIADAKPHIVALQEIENDLTLSAIRTKLREDHSLSYRYAFIQGTDSFTEQDVGILMRNGLVSFQRNEQSKSMYDSDEFYNISKHIIAEFRWGNVASPLTLMNVHYRARAEVEDKRVKQARLSRLWLEEPLAAGHDVLLVGDFNSEHPAGSLQGDIREVAQGQKSGPAMVDLLTELLDPSTATHVILDKQFDRMMSSASMMTDEPGRDWVFQKIEILPDFAIRGERDGEEHWHEYFSLDPAELDVSDHLPVMATFDLK